MSTPVAISPSARPSIYPFIHLSVYLSIYPSIIVIRSRDHSPYLSFAGNLSLSLATYLSADLSISRHLLPHDVHILSNLATAASTPASCLFAPHHRKVSPAHSLSRSGGGTHSFISLPRTSHTSLSLSLEDALSTATSIGYRYLGYWCIAASSGGCGAKRAEPRCCSTSTRAWLAPPRGNDELAATARSIGAHTGAPRSRGRYRSRMGASQ